MKKLLLMSLLALVAMTMTSCLNGGFKSILDIIAKGGGADTTTTQVSELNQAITMQSFNNVDINGDYTVIYEQGAEYSVRVEAPEQALTKMTIYVKDSVLCIHESVYNPNPQPDSVKIYLSSPELNKITMFGSGLFVAENAIDLGTDPSIFAVYPGKVLLQSVTCKGKAIFDVMDSANISISNLKGDEVIVSTDDTGNINLVTLECKYLFAGISGSGEVNSDNITADEVEALITGSGNVNLKGTVKKVTKDITGKGNLNITEATPTNNNQ